MFEIKPFDPLNTNDGEFEALYNFKVQRSIEQDIEFTQSFESWKSALLKNHESTRKTRSQQILLRANSIVGCIGFYILHLGKKEELQIIFPHVLNEVRDSYWTDFNLNIHLKLWTSQYRKSKIETSDELLIKNVLNSGFEKGNVTICMDLNVDDYNWEVINNILDDDPVSKNDLRLESIREPSELEIEQIAVLTTILLNDMKRSYTSHQFLETVETIKTGIALSLSRNQIFDWQILRDINQKMVGMSWLKYDKDNPKTFWQFMTGVLPEYRNRGLTKWIKANNYKNQLDKFPSLELIKTDCYDVNYPMIHINEILGFKMTKKSITLYYKNELA